nr:acetyl-CoA carboxylase beta subunit [Valerianella locusta]UUL71507.1 acetyl-CoA carboxylase beta subunit [Valerianella locusta]
MKQKKLYSTDCLIENKICVSNLIRSSLFISSFGDSYLFSSVYGKNKSSSQIESTPDEDFDQIEESTPDEGFKGDEEDSTPSYKHLWVVCDDCYTLNYKRFLKDKLYICEGCESHLKMNSSERIELLVDPNTWDPMNEKMASIDAIQWDSGEPFILTDSYLRGIYGCLWDSFLAPSLKDLTESDSKEHIGDWVFDINKFKMIFRSLKKDRPSLESKEDLQKDLGDLVAKDDLPSIPEKDLGDLMANVVEWNIKLSVSEHIARSDTEESWDFWADHIDELELNKTRAELELQRKIHELEEKGDLSKHINEMWNKTLDEVQLSNFINSFLSIVLHRIQEQNPEFDLSKEDPELAKKIAEFEKRVQLEQDNELEKSAQLEQDNELEKSPRLDLNEIIELRLEGIKEAKLDKSLEFSEISKLESEREVLERIQHVNKQLDESLSKTERDEAKDEAKLDFEDDPYIDRIASYQEKTGLTEAIQTGIGQLNGIPIAMGVMEFEFMGGSMGSVVGEKITRLIEYANNQSLPLIIVCASGGARMQEGSLSLMQMAKISSALFQFQTEQNLFYVSILTSPTTGGVTASFGMLGNVIVAEPNAYIAFAGKRVIEETLHQEVPEGSQETEYLFDKGLFDLVVPRKTLKSTLTELFQSHGFGSVNQNPTDNIII